MSGNNKNESPPPTSSSSIRASSRKSRVYLFREFLWNVYGDYLQEQKQNQQEQEQEQNQAEIKTTDNILVLDVAGGKGDLSWLLTHAHGIQSIVVDPQTFQSTNVITNTPRTTTGTTGSEQRVDQQRNLYHDHHIEKSVHYLLEHPEEAQSRSILGLPTFQPLAALLPQILEQIQIKPAERQQQKQQQQQTSQGCRPPPSTMSLQFQPIFHLPIYMNDNLVNAIRHQLLLIQGGTTTTTTHSNNKQQQIMYTAGANNQNRATTMKEDTKLKCPPDNQHCKVDTGPAESTAVSLGPSKTLEEDWNDFWQTSWIQARLSKPERSKRKRPPSPFSSTTSSSDTANDYNNDVRPQLLDPKIALQLFTSNIKLIVGFHPDQATEACMDLAILLNIPFCVVPCCVFPNEFPNRTIQEATTTTTTAMRNNTSNYGNDGIISSKDHDEITSTTRVRTYAQFVTYLQEKYRPHNVQTAKLNFHFTETAKNIVLYTLPPPCHRLP